MIPRRQPPVYHIADTYDDVTACEQARPAPPRRISLELPDVISSLMVRSSSSSRAARIAEGFGSDRHVSAFLTSTWKPHGSSRFEANLCHRFRVGLHASWKLFCFAASKISYGARFNWPVSCSYRNPGTCQYLEVYNRSEQNVFMRSIKTPDPNALL